MSTYAIGIQPSNQANNTGATAMTRRMQKSRKDIFFSDKFDTEIIASIERATCTQLSVCESAKEPAFRMPKENRHGHWHSAHVYQTTGHINYAYLGALTAETFGWKL